jgi:site-specific DNA recombinase
VDGEGVRELVPGPCIIYERVSTPRQVTSHVQAEVDLCLALAAEHAFPVMEVFIDKAATGFNGNREEYKRMLEYIHEHSGTLRYVVVPDVSRLWRNPVEYLPLRLAAAKQGVMIVSAREQALDDSRERLLIETALAWKAADEASEKKKRAMSAIERLVADGLWPFRPPFGYIHGQPKGYLVPDPKAAPVIRQLFDWVAVEGLKLDGACQRAQDQDIRTANGHRLTRQAVRRILTNPLYAGRIELESGIRATACFGPLVSPTVFDLVQSHRRTKAGQQRRHVPRLPLGRFVICDECGHSLSGSYSKRIYGWYRCKEGCSKVRSEDLHTMFAQLANELTSTDRSKATFRLIALEVTSADMTQEREQVSRDLETIKQRKQNLIEWRQEDAITQKEWRRSMEREREAEHLLEKRLDEINARRS